MKLRELFCDIHQKQGSPTLWPIGQKCPSIDLTPEGLTVVEVRRICRNPLRSAFTSQFGQRPCALGSNSTASNTFTTCSGWMWLRVCDFKTMRVWREATLPFAPSSLRFFASDGRSTPRLLTPLGAHFLHCFCGLRKLRLACRVLKDLPLFWEGVVAVQSWRLEKLNLRVF